MGHVPEVYVLEPHAEPLLLVPLYLRQVGERDDNQLIRLLQKLGLDSYLPFVVGDLEGLHVLIAVFATGLLLVDLQLSPLMVLAVRYQVLDYLLERFLFLDLLFAFFDD